MKLIFISEKFFELEQVILDDFVDFDFTRELEVKRIYVDKPMQNFIEYVKDLMFYRIF